MNTFGQGFKFGLLNGVFSNMFGGFGMCGFNSYMANPFCNYSFSPMFFTPTFSFGSFMPYNNISNFSNPFTFMGNMNLNSVWKTPTLEQNSYFNQNFNTFQPQYNMDSFVRINNTPSLEIVKPTNATILNTDTAPVCIIKDEVKIKSAKSDNSEKQSKEKQTTKSFDSFLKDLGYRESKGDYKVVNRYGYAGKYQMGEAALIDAGYYTKTLENGEKYNNDWTGTFTGKDGINSLEDFLNSPKAQENAQLIFKKKQWTYLKEVGALEYIGKTINGYTITASGLLAGAHLKGAGAVRDYLESGGKNNGKDANGTSVESYMKRFANYDVSEVIA